MYIDKKTYNDAIKAYGFFILFPIYICASMCIILLLTDCLLKYFNIEWKFY